MKKKMLILIIILFIVLVLSSIFLFAIYPKIKHSTYNKQFDAIEIENGEEIKAKQNETKEPYTLQTDGLTQFELEKATKAFREIMGIDIPNGATINRYYLGSDGYSAIDLVFDSKDYDHIFQTVQEAADKRLPLIFQNEKIYSDDLPNVFDYGSEFFSPIEVDWFDEDTEMLHPIIEWYIDEPESKSGAITGFTALTLLKIMDDEFHIVLQSDKLYSTQGDG